MRFLLALIGYFATATVIATSLLVGYLWRTRALDDEKVFRIIALVHDVDLNQRTTTAAAQEKTQATALTDEPSTAEADRLRDIALLNFDVKQSSLDQGRGEFGHMLRQLVEARDRFDGMARELEERIRRESDAATDENVATIVRDLRSVKADTAKDLLLRILERGTDEESKREAMGDVVRVMSSLPANTLTAILKKFTSEEDKAKLHAIHREMLAGGPKKQVLDDALRQLQDRSVAE
ncbi:MAG: hypothetical protein ACRCT8_14095 [Lacipirellulaceae bacterium]